MNMSPENVSRSTSSGQDNPTFQEDQGDPDQGNGHAVAQISDSNGPIQKTDTTPVSTARWNSDNNNVVAENNGHLPQKDEDDDEFDDDVACGYSNCKPSWLQVCNNPKVFLVFLCWFSFLQGFVINGINNVNTSSVERRFKLPSSRVGLISSSYDISAGLAVLPVTYFGTYAHQPRMLSIAALVMAFGSLVMSMPHFLTGMYDYGSGITDVCHETGNFSMCQKGNDSLPNYLYLFMFGQFLHGYGGTVLYSLGIVFIDVNVRTRDSPVYQGFLYAFAALGPAVGYVLGGYFLDIFVDFDRVSTDQVAIQPTDVQWVGAWWVGFVAAACLLLTVFIFLLPYARQLPSARKVAKYRISQVHQDGAEAVASRERFGATIKDFPTSLMLLLRNPVLMLVTLAGVTEGLVTSGLATFLAKYIQNQYGQTAAWSAMLGGFVAVPGAAGGNIFGGLITRCFNLKVRGMLRMNVILCIMVIALCGTFFAQCPVPPIAGVKSSYQNSSIIADDFASLNLTSSCNAQCGCTTITYEPVCGSDNVQYFSPCYAGCLSPGTLDGKAVYWNCSCVQSSPGMDTAVEGTCVDSCSYIYVFLPMFFLIIFLTFSASVPAVSVTLRCIPDIQRSFAIGIQWVFTRFLGTVPGPILFGYVFDRACLTWQDTCGERGSCWIYDNRGLSTNFAILGIIIKMGSATFFMLAYCCYRPPDADTPVKVTPGSDQATRTPKAKENGGTPNLAFDHSEVDVVPPGAAPVTITTEL